MDDSTKLARQRTDWAEDRTILANERTFAGWMRTGMASVALALGLRAVFRPFEPTWVPKAVATIFIIVAVMIFFSAWKDAKRTAAQMTEHDANAKSAQKMAQLALILSLGAVLTGGVLLWL